VAADAQRRRHRRGCRARRRPQDPLPRFGHGRRDPAAGRVLSRDRVRQHGPLAAGRARAADCAVPPGVHLLTRGGRALHGGFPDHQSHQRRPARREHPRSPADQRSPGPGHHGHRDCPRAACQPRARLAAAPRRSADAGCHRHARAPRVAGAAGAAIASRRGQPPVARTARRRAHHPGVRPHCGRPAALPGGQRRASAHRSSVAHDARHHHAGADSALQPRLGGSGVDRGDPGGPWGAAHRQPDRLPHLRDGDPGGGGDSCLPADDRPPGSGVRDPDPRGAGHERLPRGGRTRRAGQSG
jgi:hypothetical protein